MAANPSFIGTPRIGIGSVTTGQTARTTGTTSNLVDVITGASTGTRILEVVVKSTGQPADSVVTLWLNDGTNNILFDEIDVGAPAAGSNTVVAYRTSQTYANLILPSASWKLVAGCTVTPTSGAIVVHALGGDL
jgi:hypothetical protein